jgi:hypothetical protein
MDATAWNSCTKPDKMLAYLEEAGRATERKLRLFTVACCRRIWHLLVDERSRKAVEVTERFADGAATDQELEVVSHDAWAFTLHIVHEDEAFFHLDDTALNAADAPAWAAEWPVDPLRVVVAAQRALGTTEGKTQTDLIRCIVGNPFRPLPLLTWNDGTIKSLAEAAYEHRILPSGELDTDRIAILSDALEEAGVHAALIEHLRGAGPHVRGCVVIDLLTGRE